MTPIRKRLPARVSRVLSLKVIAMKVGSIGAPFLLVCLVACSGGPSTSALEADSGPPCCVEPPRDEPRYPTGNIGTAPRQGDKPGNRIANYKFLGYPNADVGAGLKRIALSDFYDPTGETTKIIHIQAVGVWCSPCKAETSVVGPMKADLEAKKVVWLVSLAEGPAPGSPAYQKDLDGWLTTSESPYTHWLDPANKNLGPFYDRARLPWNANIDATTMEILTARTGAVTDSASILAEIDEALDLASKSTLRTSQ
jgi:hypothetical protein